MSQYSFLIDNMVWSFSRLNSFHICQHEWYLQYIDECKGDNNFYAEFGSFCHKILEKYAKGELGIFDLATYFDEHYDEAIQTDVFNKGSDTKEKYRKIGIDYFQNVDLDFENYEILGIEKKCNFEIEGHQFTGYIDLLLRDKSDGRIILIDHKSSDYPIGKRGGFLKQEKEKFEQYKKQLHLYCEQVFKEYGEYPKQIGWNYFKCQKWLFLDFDEEEFKASKNWALATIVEINQTEFFPPNPDFFYCHNLCRFRNSYCEYKGY